MGFEVSERARRVWDEWNLRAAVLCSLFFQILLSSLANYRRKRGGGVIGAIIWSSYLLADWIAAFAIGLISSGITDHGPGKAAVVNNQLAAFWAPFLLLHLGGPDAITAFSLEDNELWIRHLMGLAIQVVAVVYVFLQSLTLEDEYWVPTVLVFFAGACKYAERTLSLYKACLGNFKRSLLPKPEPGPNYALLMEDFSALKASHLPVDINIVKEIERGMGSGSAGQISSQPEPFKGIVEEGYRFFKIFKGLVVDLMFSFEERNESRRFFFARKAADAFKVMEVELNFLYDVLHTKAAVAHSRIGYLCRFLCTVLMLACLALFAALPHHNVFLIDKIVTYVLLVGAIALDVAGAFNLVLSDWALVSSGEVARKHLNRLGSWRVERRRWSNRMGQHSFISICVKEDGRFIRWINNVAHLFGVEESLDELLYKKEFVFKEETLKELVFEELKAKAKKAESIKDAKEIYSARGGYVLCGYPIYYEYRSIEASLSDEVEYDESLLIWHIATELCYFTAEKSNDQNVNDTTKELRHPRMEFCKILSDYMLYLLVMRPTLMSTVAGIAKIRFQDTCEEANRFFQRRKIEEKEAMLPLKSRFGTGQIWFQDTWEKASKFFKRQTKPRDLEMKACKMLLGVKMTNAKPNQVKGDRSKSLLFDACILAKDLMKLNKDRRWEMMSRIWVELLSYAATRCRPSDHARQLTQGGELITFVWLLMVHFGLAEQFRIEAGDARAKLLVGKGDDFAEFG